MRRVRLPTILSLSLLAPLTFASAARAQSDLPPPPPPPPTDFTPAPPSTPAAATAPAAPRPPAHTAATAAELPPAEPPGATRWKPMMRAGMGLEAYWFSAKGVGSTFPLIPYGVFGLSQDVLLDVHLPLSFATDTSLGFRSEKAGLGLGNPTVGVTYVTTESHTTWHFGGRISAPLAGASDSQPWQVANILGAYSMTLWDLHYWAYKYVPIGARIGVEYQAKPNFFMRASVDPTLYIPIDDANSSVVGTRKTLLAYQLRAELEGRGESGWGGGLGFQVVHLVSESSSDNAQGAFEPFVSYDSATTFARLGALVALDPPLGFGFDKGKVASLRLNVGSHF